MEKVVTVYDTRSIPPKSVVVDVGLFYERLNYAVYRFWVSERRLPAAIVIPEQLAQVLFQSVGNPLIGELRHYGYFRPSDHEEVPFVGRPAYLGDSLFTLL